jgi:CubicO group peptidase (beta-lactamase class C family)
MVFQGPLRKQCLLHLLIFAASASAQAQDAVDDFVRTEMERQKTPGVSIAVIRRGEIVKVKGYGLANVEHQVPVKPETIFESGSMGKQFTSTAVMLLVEDGKIALTDSIAKYFPEAPERFRPITVRHLLTHTSGIPDYTTGTMDYRRDYTEDDLAKLAFGLTLEFPAGSRWNYSNTGYVLLGVLVHRASGKFYGDILRDRVFAPLGMKTARIISEADIVPNRAAGYRLQNGELKNQNWVAPMLNTTADGSLYLSILDLIAWDRGLRARSVLRPESWAQVFTPAALTSGKHYPYGFGWGIREVAGQTVYEHGGSWQGFKTHIVRYQGDDLTVIALANLAQAQPERFCSGIVKILAAHLVPPIVAPPSTDDKPALTERMKEVLAATAEGKLSPGDFAYLRAGFFPDGPKRYQDLLRDAGAVRKVTLLSREELGDDVISRYNVMYMDRTLTVTLGVAPDGKISQFSLQRRATQ